MSFVLSIIGAGSSYTPELIEGLIKRKNELALKKIILVDIEAGREKLKINTALAKRMFSYAKMDIQVIETLDLDEGIRDADYVITQLRVGGLAARGWDEKIPLRHGVIGQETTGAGGFSKAMRTLPVLLNIAKTIERYDNKAILINFTNPAGMMTEALLKHTKVKTIGLCNVPLTMRMNIAKMLSVKWEDLSIDYIGLNHLVYGHRIYLKGEDITQTVLNEMMSGNSFSMKNIPDLAFNKALLKSLQMIPCPYHRYFYHRQAMLEEEIKALKISGQTRADQVQAIETSLFELYKATEVVEKPKELEERGGAYYSDAAISLVSSLYNDKGAIHTVNVQNNGAVIGLTDDTVIECNAIVDSRGARPIAFGKIPGTINALIQSVKSYELLAIESIVQSKRHLGLQALIAHPLVGDADIAEAVLTDLIEANKDYFTYKED